MFFISMRDEVLTLPMIELALREGKRVAAPRTIVSEHRMIPVEAESRDGRVPLRRGGYRIMEPESEKIVGADEIDFVVVPGDTPSHAIVEQPVRTFVVKGGRLVAQAGEYLPTGQS